SAGRSVSAARVCTFGSGRRTSRLPLPSIATDLAGMLAFFSSSTTRSRKALSIATPPARAEVTCTDGSSGYALGNAYKVLRISTSRMAKYFQRGKVSIEFPAAADAAADYSKLLTTCWSWSVLRLERVRCLRGLERALGQD